MLTGTLPPQSRRATYVETLELTDSDAPHDLIDLSGLKAATVSIRTIDGEDDVLSATLGNGVVSPAFGILQWRFEAGSLLGLAAAPYRLLVSVTASTGEVVELVDAVIPLT